jgi:hypothetical protein
MNIKTLVNSLLGLIVLAGVITPGQVMARYIPLVPTRVDYIARTGIAGNVFITNCAVIPIGETCQPQPFQAHIIIYTEDASEVVADFTTGSNGTFKWTLLPGTYLVVPQSPNLRTNAESQVVTVDSSGMTTIDIFYDGGMR